MIVPMESAERREAPRVSMFSSLELVLPNGEIVGATAMDVSETGVSIWATGERPNASFRIRLPLDDGLDPLEVDGVIAREFRSDGGSVWGIEFQGLSEGAKMRLKLYVEKHV